MLTRCLRASSLQAGKTCSACQRPQDNPCMQADPGGLACFCSSLSLMNCACLWLGRYSTTLWGASCCSIVTVSCRHPSMHMDEYASGCGGHVLAGMPTRAQVLRPPTRRGPPVCVSVCACVYCVCVCARACV